MMPDESATLGKGVFSGDYAHFEQNHAAFPVEAQAVFHSVTELRAALGAFRKATENTCVVDDEIAVANVLPTTDEEDAVAREITEAEAVGIPEDSVSEILAEASLDSPTRVTDVSFSDA